MSRRFVFLTSLAIATLGLSGWWLLSNPIEDGFAEADNAEQQTRRTPGERSGSLSHSEQKRPATTPSAAVAKPLFSEPILGSYERGSASSPVTDKQIVENMTDRLDGAESGEKILLLERLGRLPGNGRIFKVCAQALRDPDPGVREAASRILLQFNDPMAISVLKSELRLDLRPAPEFARAVKAVVATLEAAHCLPGEPCPPV